MRLWFQGYNAMGFDPTWRYSEEAIKRRVAKVVRPGTQVAIHGVRNMSPGLVYYHYFQYMHASQVIDSALRAQQEGYDAFVLGGMLDLGFYELREVVDIPVLYIGETSFYVACLLAPRFSVVAPNEGVLRGIGENIRRYGLQERYVPGVALGPITLAQLAEDIERNPSRVVEAITEVARGMIERGADIVVPGSGTLSLFLIEQGVTQIDGVPVLDNTGILIKMAELMVDLGVKRSKHGLFSAPSKEEVIAARKLYGFE